MENKSTQKLSSDNSTINDSNNHHGNAGRDIINNYGGYEDFYNGKVPRQIDIIKSQRAVIAKFQRQIDRMQDQMEEYQRQFSKAQDIKEQLVKMLLDDREMLKDRLINGHAGTKSGTLNKS